MEALAQLVATHEDWLMNRVLVYAKQRDYVRYTSTLAEAWRISIAGLSESLLGALRVYDGPPELGPDDDYSQDPIASFGVLEAQKHRARGVTLDLFLGLMKYYRQGYVDLILQAGLDLPEQDRCRAFVDRFFDRVELGFCVEWATLSENEKTDELQATNRRLTNEKNRYLTVFESLRDPAILLDREGRVSNLNHAAAQTFEGITVPGARYYDRAPVEQVPPWLASELTSLAAGDHTEITVERELETREGLRQFEIKLEHMLDVSDKFAGTVVTFHDITQRTRTEAMLHYRGEFARLVSEISTRLVGLTPEDTDETVEQALKEVGVFAHADSAYVFRFTDNRRRLSMTHLWQSGRLHTAKQDLQGLDAEAMSWWMARIRRNEVVAVSAVDDLPREATVEKGILRSQGIGSLIDVPLSYKGHVIGFMGLSSLESRRVWTEDEVNLLRIVGQVFTNAIQHKGAEEALARERNLLRTLVDNLPDYIYAKDSSSRFTLNNAAHLRLLRAKTPEEVVGKTDYDIFAEELASRYFADEQAVIESGQPLVNREETVITEKGEKHWLLTTKVPLKDAQGNPIGIVGMSRNITERKHMAEALSNHAELLERANLDLEQRNRELDEFTYVASHDLQEPLRKLIAYSDVLQEDMGRGDEEEVARDLDVITSAARRMRQLVQDLLALSRSGRQEMTWDEVSIGQCVDRALDALELRVEETAAEIQRAQLPVVRADPSLLTQLFQNLIGNALKFHGERPPRIRITAEETEGHWLLGVADEGIGIKPEYAEQIFSPFKRLHRRGEYEGTGIGLAICRKIVERHGGSIWVVSEPGKGAHFRFTLGETGGEGL